MTSQRKYQRTVKNLVGWGVQILGKGRGPVFFFWGGGLIFIEGIRTLLHALLHHSITLLQLIYNNEADAARIFLFYFNKICKSFFSNAQQLLVHSVV